MKARRRPVLVLCALLLVLAAAGGCAAFVVPTAAGTAPVMVAGWGPDSRNSFWVARYDDVLQATLSAGETLSLQLETEETEDGQAELVFADDIGKQVRLDIKRRTETVTRVRIESDVSGMASLLGRQIVDELQQADAFLVDWSQGGEQAAE